MEPIRREDTEMDLIREDGMMRDLTHDDLIRMGLDRKGKWQYTVKDLERLPEGVYAELIDGEIFVRMTTPATIHQELVGELFFQISLYIRRKKGKCRVFPAPLGVEIKNDIHNFVIPDIALICDKDILDEKGCHGAPDLVIEIVSSNRKLDYVHKLALYKEAGVREYWIVDPKHERVTVYDLEHGKEPMLHSFSERIKVGVYDDLYLDISDRRSALEEALETERKASREEGHAQGLAEGETRLAQLTSYLLREDRMDDLKKALADSRYREELLQREHIPDSIE
ncbi:MAG: Uma2 family endonuclease [Ruminococcus flavefaciens]|nr:Uma2 family endonuclease [Ruminococcus flavefaciens]